jgi:hypothetical protein
MEPSTIENRRIKAVFFAGSSSKNLHGRIIERRMHSNRSIKSHRTVPLD